MTKYLTWTTSHSNGVLTKRRATNLQSFQMPKPVYVIEIKPDNANYWMETGRYFPRNKWSVSSNLNKGQPWSECRAKQKAILSKTLLIKLSYVIDPMDAYYIATFGGHHRAPSCKPQCCCKNWIIAACSELIISCCFIEIELLIDVNSAVNIARVFYETGAILWWLTSVPSIFQ